MLSAVVVMAVASLLVAGIGYLGWQGRLPRNHWVGIRLPATLATDERWRVAHEAAGPWLAGSGLFAFFAAIISAAGGAVSGSDLWPVAGIGVAAFALLSAALVSTAAALGAVRGLPR